MARHKSSAYLIVERGDDEFELDITGNVYPGSPATSEDPPEDWEVEITSVLCDGKPFELTEAETTEAEEKLTSALLDYFVDSYYDNQEREYDRDDEYVRPCEMDDF